MKNNVYKKLLFFTALCLTTNLLTMYIQHSGYLTLNRMQLYFQTYQDLINTWNHGGETPLFIATKEKNLPKVKDLLKKGANPNQRNRDTNNTPLTLAISIGSLDCVKLLLKNGSSPRVFTVNDGNKYYPEDELDWECKSPAEGYIFLPRLSKKDNYAIHAALLKARLKQLQKETMPIYD